MIPFWAWSWLLMAVGLTGLYISGSRSKWGWCVSILSECLWIAYALDSGQPGFIVAAFAYIAVDARNFLNWHRRTV